MASLTGAVILAGGEARRMGGQDKLMATISGSSILARVVAACVSAGAAQPVVVGPVRPRVDGVRWAQESPPGAGPVAAVAAGLALLEQPGLVAVLAGDLPFVTADLLRRLADEAPAVAVDDEGCEQWLLGVHRDVHPAGERSMRALLDHPGLTRVPVAGPATWDCDTPEDLERAQRL